MAQFQILGICVFLWQTFTSLSRYISDPTVYTVESSNLAGVSTLQLIACDMEQFSVSKSRALGYKWKLSFLQGSSWSIYKMNTISNFCGRELFIITKCWVYLIKTQLRWDRESTRHILLAGLLWQQNIWGNAEWYVQTQL